MMNRYLPSGIYPSSVPLPASPCAPPAPSLPPPDVLGPVEVPALPTATVGLTAEAEPGLTPRSLVFNKLLKKFCNTSCCVCPVGLVASLQSLDCGSSARADSASRPPRGRRTRPCTSDSRQTRHVVTRSGRP